MGRKEISTAFQQMTFRPEFYQLLLHLETYLRDVNTLFNNAKAAPQQVFYDLGIIRATKLNELPAMLKK